MFRKFAQSRSGNFAILSGLAVVPLCLAAGLAIDYSRHLSAQKHLQEMVDATSLSLAASREKDQTKLERMADDFLTGNQNVNRLQNVRLNTLKATDDDVDLDVSGSIPTTFMALAGYERLDVRASALAERAVNGNVEVALVLDNTDSMSEAVDGTTRIAALKTAAKNLIDELLREDDGAVRIGIVPYAEYVNVGTNRRSAPWLNVDPDKTTWRITQEALPARTELVTRRWESKLEWIPKSTCSQMRDGVRHTYDCGNEWRGGWVDLDEPYEVQREAQEEKKAPTHYTWYGCVASRIQDDNRLHDRNPSERYRGFVDTKQVCPTPIVELTGNRTLLRSEIDKMTTRIGNHVSQTYIPAGMVWGLNLLSPTEPFTQAAAYDPANMSPRKVAVLMTDGANTVRFRAKDKNKAVDEMHGMHQSIGLDTEIAYETDKRILATNADTAAICTNMKRQGIEIFTIAFMVKSPNGKALLEECATSATHYFDASSSNELLAAFENIGNSLRVVRLAR